MQFMSVINAFIKRLFAGKHGYDELNLFLLFVGVLFVIFSSIFRAFTPAVATFLFLGGLIILLWSVWRSFSKDHSQRSLENSYFVNGKFYSELKGMFNRFRLRKDYRFYRCPGCREWLRIPNKMGTFEIKCPKCHSKFRKSIKRTL